MTNSTGSSTPPAVIFIAHLLPHTTSPSAHYCYHHYVPSVRFFFFLFFYTSPCLTPVGQAYGTRTTSPHPSPPPTTTSKAMDDILAEDPVYYDSSVTPPVFRNQQGLSVLQRLAKLEESQASLQDSHTSLQRKVAELEPTQLCAEIICEPVLNIEAGLSNKLDLVLQCNRTAHRGAFLADK